MAEGHFFTPSNDILVDGYLRARIDGTISDHAMASLFHDADVCSARPPDLVRDHTPARVPCRDAGEGLQWIFFSPARFFGNSTKKRSRAVDGTNEKESWHSEGSPKAVEGSAGGYVQKFSYHVRTATGTVQKPGWIMAEYTFKNTTRPGDVVLCKIYRSPRGQGRSNASSSSGASSAKSGTKRKAADDGEHLVAATPSTRPRLADEDDVIQFAEDIERNLLSQDDQDGTALEFEETTQHVEESPHPEPQVAPAASVEGVDMKLQEMETFMMADEEDDGTMLRVPDGEDPEAFYTRVMDLLGDDQQQDAAIQQQDAAIQTARGLLSEYDVIAALATGVTVDELLLIDGPSMPCFHPGGALGVICG